MSTENIQANKQQACIKPYSSSIRIIGKYPFNHIQKQQQNQQQTNEHQHHGQYYQHDHQNQYGCHNQSMNVNGKKLNKYRYPKIKITSFMSLYCPEIESRPDPYHPNPKKIFVENNFIAFIDWYDNLWFVSDLFPGFWNMSLIYYKRAKNVYLSEGECIISNKKSPILLNWGAKKVLQVSEFESVKINQRYSKQAINYFTAYSMSNYHKDDRFLYSNIKKMDNSNKLYHMRTQMGDNIDGRYSKKSIKQKTLINFNTSSHHFNASSSAFGNSQINNFRNSSKNKESTYNHSVIAYPTHQVSFMKNKVIGVSVGKVHCMCWDTQGILYTWGNRSLALGYENLPQQKITTKPQPVTKLNKFVTMGFAATHYSIVVTSDGSLYEWGIKKQENKLNQQLIFEPRQLKLCKNSPQKEQKVIILKGHLEKIVVMNSKHQLYIWGQKSGKFLNQETQKQYNFKNGYIYQPFQIPHLDDENIVDFDVCEDYIAVVVSENGQYMVSEQEKNYWNDMIQKVKYKLKLNNGIKTEAAQNQPPKQQIKSPAPQQNLISQIETLQFFQQPTEYCTSIEKTYRQRNLKKQYFKQIINEDRFFVNLMRGSKVNKNNYYMKQEKDSVMTSRNRLSGASRFLFSDRHSETQLFSSDNGSRNMKRLQSQNAQNAFDILEKINMVKNHRNSGSDSRQLLLNQKKTQSQFIKNSDNKKAVQSMKKSMMSQFRKTSIQNYQIRLQKVKQKKKSLQKSYNEQISKKIQQNSIQYRNLRHQQLLKAKIHEKNKNLLKNTLQSFLIKNYIVRMIMAPIQEGRKIKIEQFAKNLHISRIQKNLKSIFVKARVRFRLGKLKKLNFIGFAILCHMFKRFVKQKRQIKAKKMRKTIAQQIYKYVIKEKIKFGLSKTQLNARKLQKFRQWLVMTKIERLKCLRVLWKNHLLSIVKVSSQAESLPITKAQESTTFQALYRQKVAQNPMLKLQVFLDKSPIFELRSEYFQSIIFLFKKDNKAKSQKIMKNMKMSRKKRIKFSGQCELISGNTGLSNFGDLLPYSLHYNLLIRPKSMEINIPENMKKNQNWIRQQIKIFQKCLNQIIETHEKNFLKAHQKYDMDLAYFIREKYDNLAEKRWKYLVEYNQIKQSIYKKKREKQLSRIFNLIGLQRVLNQDCLPEKYLMLDEAIRKKDAPLAPTPYISFGISQFREAFKKYYELISLKAKQARKNYV